MMPQSDQLLEDIYTLINRQKDECQRLELARIGKLAIEYRINEKKRKAMERAVERRAAERKALIGLGRNHTPEGAPVCLQGAPTGQPEREA